MTEATASLTAEHRLIGRVLASLGTFASRIDPAEPALRRDLADYVEFFRRFVEGRHERIEEDVLFGEMARHGRGAGPVAVMLEERRQRADRISEMEAVALGEGPLGAEEAERLAEAMAAYAGQMRAHILKEDRMLFPLAEAILAEEQLAEVAARMAALGKAAPGHRRLLSLAERLVERYPPVT